MVSAKEIDRQLKNIGVSFWFLGNAELRELRHILVEGEVIEHCLLGRYEGGFALLCATNLRLLLIDKKPFYLTLEDVRYDMIVEVDFAHRLLDATIRICTPNKTLRFTTTKKHQLRLMTAYIQHRVMMFRQQLSMPQQGQGVNPQYAPTPAATTSWQPQVYLEQPAPQPESSTPSPMSMKHVGQAAITESMHEVPAEPVQVPLRSAYVANPYAQSSLIMRQRVSRF